MNDSWQRRLEELPFFTVAQTAERWQCSERTVRREIARKALTVHRIRGQLRISQADLKTYERLHRMD